MKDIGASWREIIYMCLVAFGLSVVITFLFRFLAGIIVWIIVAVFALAAFLAPIVVWYLWYVKKKDFDAKNGNGTETTSSVENAVNQEVNKVFSSEMTSADSAEEVKNWLIIAIVVTIVAVSLRNFQLLKSRNLKKTFLKLGDDSPHFARVAQKNKASGATFQRSRKSCALHAPHSISTFMGKKKKTFFSWLSNEF